MRVELPPMHAWLPPLVLAALLVGCVHSGVRQAPLWGFEGKLSIRAPEASRILALSWNRYESLHQLELRGALGVTVASVQATPERVTVVTGDVRRDFPHDLVLPLNGGERRIFIRPLLAWMDALAEGAAEPEPALGGWRVEVLRREGDRPSLVRFAQDDLVLRLKVTRWR